MFPASENADIQMESERVVITLLKDRYDVDASFVFRNTGDATTVLMGFPVSYGGVLFADNLLNEIGPVMEIRTWVNNKRVPFTSSAKSLRYGTLDGLREIFAPSEIQEFKEQLKNADERKRIQQIKEVWWYVKEVAFSRKDEPLETRVRYTAKYGKDSAGTSFSASYIYGSGKAWKDTIEHAEFTVHTSRDIWMNCYPVNPHRHGWRRKGEYVYSLEMDNFEPNKNDRLDFSLSNSIPPYFNEWGIYPPGTVLTDEILSLCNRRHLERFLSYRDASRNGAKDEEITSSDNHLVTTLRIDPALITVKEFEYVQDYLQNAIKKNFKYSIKESQEIEKK